MDQGSFRDPDGFVYFRDNEVFRCISSTGIAGYRDAREHGIYERLWTDQLLIKHREIETAEHALPGSCACLSYGERLPMISYPWEWPVSMLLDAGLMHLDIMQKLEGTGFWLRDASALNVQFDGERLVFIDTLSVGRRVADLPWVGYRQFCSHFVAPLSTAKYNGAGVLGLWRHYMDGFPLDLTKSLLPMRARLRPGLLIHLFLHAAFQGASRTAKRSANAPRKFSNQALHGLVVSLRSTLAALAHKPRASLWREYREHRSYTVQTALAKAAFVQASIEKLKPKIVWDLGANTGEYSLIAAKSGAFVVSLDGDPECTEALYQQTIARGRPGVLPLTMDLGNPSPDMGWALSERASLQARGPADLVMALALVHHLVFVNCVPLEKIARWLANLGRYLLIEYIPRSDPMTEQLISAFRQGAHPYNLELFRSSFFNWFTPLEESKLDNGRILFLCESRNLQNQ